MDSEQVWTVKHIRPGDEITWAERDGVRTATAVSAVEEDEAGPCVYVEVPVAEGLPVGVLAVRAQDVIGFRHVEHGPAPRRRRAVVSAVARVVLILVGVVATAYVATRPGMTHPRVLLTLMLLGTAVDVVLLGRAIRRAAEERKVARVESTKPGDQITWDWGYGQVMGTAVSRLLVRGGGASILVMPDGPALALFTPEDPGGVAPAFGVRVEDVVDVRPAGSDVAPAVS